MAGRPQPFIHRVVEVFLVFLRLACTFFGGPIVHLGYFQAEFVERRGWLSLATFTEIALAQSLTGPASSQVGSTRSALTHPLHFVPESPSPGLSVFATREHEIRMNC